MQLLSDVGHLSRVDGASGMHTSSATILGAQQPAGGALTRQLLLDLLASRVAACRTRHEPVRNLATVRVQMVVVSRRSVLASRRRYHAARTPLPVESTLRKSRGSSSRALIVTEV